MKVTREMTDQLRDEFRSHTCPAPSCKALKRDGTAFCRKCYFSLPLAMQRALWRPVGRGYEEAVIAAKQFFQTKQKDGATA